MTKHTHLLARPLAWALLPLAATLTAGCGGGGGGVSLPGPDPTRLSLSAPTPEGLTATLMQDKSTIAVTTGTVNYAMTLTNGTQAPLAVSLPRDDQGNPLPLVTLSVKGDAGDVVYPAGTLTVPPPGGALRAVTLQPGDFVQQTLQISNAFRVIGRYQAVATFGTNGGQTAVGPLTLTAR